MNVFINNVGQPGVCDKYISPGDVLLLTMPEGIGAFQVGPGYLGRRPSTSADIAPGFCELVTWDRRGEQLQKFDAYCRVRPPKPFGFIRHPWQERALERLITVICANTESGKYEGATPIQELDDFQGLRQMIAFERLDSQGDSSPKMSENIAGNLLTNAVEHLRRALGHSDVSVRDETND